MTEADDFTALVAAAQAATMAGTMRWVGADNATTLRWRSQHVAVTLSSDGTVYTLAIVDAVSHHELGSTTSATTSGLDTLWSAAQASATDWPAALTNAVAAVQALT